MRALTPISQGRRAARSFARGDDGAAMVEFALVLPMMLIVFAVMVEGSRLLMSYQAAITGVREATRYIARVAPANVCSHTGTWPSDATEMVTAIVKYGADGTQVLPRDVTINSVTPSYACFAKVTDSTGTDYTPRNGPAAVAQVVASVTIDFPFGTLFQLAGGTSASITTTVTDRSRIFGS